MKHCPQAPTAARSRNPDFDALVDRLRQLEEERPASDPAVVQPEYYITKYKPAGHTIRIWSATDEDWLLVQLLTLGWSWVCVDDGIRPRWEMKNADQIRPDDLLRLAYLKLP